MRGQIVMRYSTLRFLIVLIAPALCFATSGLHDWEIRYDGSIQTSHLDVKITKAGEWDHMAVPELSCVTEKGAPNLPMKLVYVALDGQNEVLGARCAVECERVDGTFRIRPTPEHRQVGDGEEIPLEPDPRIYGSQELYPESAVELLGVGDLYGQRIAVLAVYPFQVRPALGELWFNRTLDLSLEYGGVQRIETRPFRLKERHRDLFETMVRGRVFNPEDVRIQTGSGGAGIRSLPEGSYDYVVITSETLEPSFEPLTDWKTRKGVPSTIVTTAYIYSNYSGASNAERIRNFIVDANADWGAIWFLLGGDTSVIPYSTYNYVGDAIPSDFYYGDVDDDWFSEVFVGRATADNASEADIFVDKVLTYEVDPPLTDYPLKALFMGFDLDASTPSEVMKDAIDTYYVPAQFDPITKVYDSDASNHKSDAISGLNQGYHLVNHSDHCNQWVLGVGYVNHGWTLSTGQVQGLTNGDEQSIFYSLGCWTNAYDYNDCIAEYFVRNASGGGVGYIGNSRYGWYIPGSYNAASMRYDRAFFKSLFQDSIIHLGQTLADSKDDNYPYDSYTRYIVCELTLLGDPEMPIWTDGPDALDVTHESVLPQGISDFDVSVTSGGSPVDSAFVCLFKAEDVYECGYTDAAGELTLEVEPDSNGTMYVTVTRHNYVPYADSAEVGGLPAPALYFPVDGEWVADSLIVFDWESLMPSSMGPEGGGYDSMPGCPGYVLHVSTLPDYSDTVFFDSTGLDSMCVELPEGPFHWQVWLHNGFGIEGPPGRDSFGVDVSEPSRPDLVFPTSGFVSNQSYTFFLWSSSDDPVSGIAGYILQYADNPDFLDPATWWTTDTTYYEPVEDTTHYWRVRSVDNADIPSEWSAEWSFTIDTNVPDAPELQEPVGGTWLTDTLVDFRWGEVTLNAPGEYTKASKGLGGGEGNLESTPVAYVMLVSESSGLLDTVALDTLSSDSTVLDLEDGFYYWQLYAYDEAGNVSMASLDSFGVDVTSPPAPGLLSPTDGCTLSYTLTDTLTFLWSAVLDASSGLDFYELYYTDTTVQCTPPETTFCLTPYPVCDFTWKVRAIDVAGNEGPWSEEWSFILTSVAEGESEPKPSVLRLAPGRPNPARDHLSIRYEIPREGRVSLRVFNAAGILVREIEAGTLTPNRYESRWNLDDGRGERVSPGIYLIALEMDGRKFSRKVVVAE
jgi:hypothetical protein